MRKLYTLFFLSIYMFAVAQVPVDYYNSADAKSGAALRTALQTIITNGHSVVSYAGLWTAYGTTDRNSSGKIWDTYSNCSFTYQSSQCGTYQSECDCYNREHTTPQSWFGEASPMVSDLFNVYPTDGKVNGIRSNYPYGEVGTATNTTGNGCKLGSSSFLGYSGTVFEPIDEFKGDFARTYFYMATRYASVCESWGSGATVVYGSEYGLTTYARDLFLKWSRQDPVSAKEIARNNASYLVQNNRNPYIDFPGLEEYFWGNLANTTFFKNGTTSPTYLASPSAGITVAFGSVPYQMTSGTTVTVKGVNLTGDLTVALGGNDASEFTLGAATITKDNAEAGYVLNVNFLSQNLGAKTATITISGGGIAPIQVNVTATSTDNFIATAASAITANGFTANWTNSTNATGYVLNVYSIVGNTANLPQTLLEEGFATAVLPTGWSALSTGYYDFVLAGSVKLGSSSKVGLITTPAFDLSTRPTTLTVSAKQFGTDNGAILTAFVDNRELAAWTTAVDFQDFTVNVPVQTSASKFTFSVVAGKRAYIDAVKVSTQGTTLTPVSVIGYPTNVGNVLSYTVTGLEADSAYYYTVTPEGNNTGVSSQIPVRTASTTGLSNNTAQSIVWTVTTTGVQLKNLPNNCSISVYNMMGKQVQSIRPVNSDATFNLPTKGVYLLRVIQNQSVSTYKIRY